MSGRESLLPDFFVRNGNSERIQQRGYKNRDEPPIGPKAKGLKACSPLA